MEFQIFDVDYVVVDGRPIIRVFGKTINGESVCGFYENYLPYIYVDDEKALNILKNEPQVHKIKKVRRKIIGDMTPRDMYKVFLKNPAKTPEIRERLKANGLNPYEADILFKYRFMCDLGLKGLSWIRVADGSPTSTNTVRVSKTIRIKEFECREKLEDAEMKILALDIECISTRPGDVPDAKRDPIIMVSMVFNSPYEGKKQIVLSTRNGEGVFSFSTEKEMLEEFIDIINKYDPDIITGYNINGFDLPYIINRMKENNVRPLFGRCNQKSAFVRSFGIRNRITITGRVVVDSFEIVKKDFSLQRYGLDFVAEKLLGERKIDVKHSEIEKLWRGNEEEFKKLVEYSIKDSVLAMDLVLKLNLIDKYIALSKVSGTLLQDTLDSGETSRIENFLLKEFNRAGYVFPCKPEQSEVKKRERERAEKLKGGFVLEPEKKLHSNVLVMDFKSMYPSIFITYNICPTTIVKDGNRQGLIETPSGAKFLPKNIQYGIIPKILEGVMKQRQAVKKKLKECKDENKKRALDAEQWALKIMANAFYGHMGYVRSRIYDLDIANAITTCGRETIKETAAKIEREFGYKIVYGDTDSVFVKVPEDDTEKLSEIGKGIALKITEELPGIMELEFEKIFRRFLPLTKKRYVAWKLEHTGDGWKEGIEMKGIETVRRDWCGLVGDTIKNVIDIILKKNDVKASVKYFKGVIQDLVNGKIPIEKLVITKTMTKSPKHYAGIQPHIELAKKIEMRNPNDVPGIGDRIGYVIVKGTQLLSKRAEDPAYVLEKGLQVDSNYYVENQLLPPLEKIFRGLGVSKSELLGNGRQIGILDAIRMNGHKQPEHKMPKEINANEINGFICSKCNEFYRRVPLVGRCECGGSLLFSSPKGPAESAVVQ